MTDDIVKRARAALESIDTADSHAAEERGRVRAIALVPELVAEVERLRELCGEVWGWDRARELGGGQISGPLSVALRTRLYLASNGEADRD